ncbi:DUF5801 repeats-in-toxin domain-containing protein, partial [Afipia sp. DC4300-2b1]|uniref:T1SS-143 repeat domain-containing protein n=1 Tax=Afipia sp. DC4300-2b1 TaxID=2804672 RepID=UPI003CF54A5C
MVNYGADGPSANPLTSAVSLVLTGTAGAGYKTNLVATALTGGPLAGTSVDHRTVWLTVEDGQIVGRIGHDTAGTGDDYVVLRISLSSTDPATAQLIVDQFLPIDHDASEPAGAQAPENPSLFDETISLLMANASQGIGVKLTVTATDGDNDSVTKTATANIVSNNTSVVSFDDDGPTPSIAATNGALNGLFFDGFVSNSPQWGVGSGINSTGTAGAWHIAASDYEGASTVQLERVGDGYRGADSPTNSVMVDMEATPGNVQLTQDLTLTPGALYHLTFEIGAANDPGIANSAKLEVFWNGQSVGVFVPTSGVMQTISVDVTAAGANNQLTFKEIGEAGDNTGTFLANVKLSDVIIIDETKGVDADSDDTTGLGALFSTVTNVGPVGFDPDMDQPQYAQGKDPVVTTGVADYGTDGPAAVDPRVIGLSVSSAGVDSGLTTTEGKAIHLYLEGKLVVGRYDSDNNGSYDTAAFALSIDPNTGILSIAQYVSLHHPIAGQNDDGVYLNANTLLATVTLTDGDGDHATSSADISSAVRFEDDGPSIDPLQNSSLRDWTIDEDVLPAAGHATPIGNDALDNPADTNDYTQLNGKPLGVTWGADGPKALTFAATDSHHPTIAITDGNGVPQPALTSGGVPLVYDIQTNVDGGQTLIAYKGAIAPANQIFTLTLDPDAGNGGTFSFELTGALDHPAGNGQNTLNLKLGFIATDGDDDTATSFLTLRITDDVPYLTNPYQSANLILNGSFEDHGPVGNPGFNTFEAINHWTSGPDNVPFEIQQGNIGDLLPQDGIAKVELDSDPLNNPTSQLNATIQQTISTPLAAGDSYELSFWYSPRPNDGNPDSSSLKVYWNGVVVHTIDSSTQADGWQHVSVLVTAQAGSNTVAFQGSGQPNQLGAYLDNVSLIPAITVDEDGLTGPLSYGNHDSQPGDNVVPNSEGGGQDNNEATATGNLNIKWGADDNDSGVDGFSGTFNSFVQDHPNGVGDRSVTFTNANVAVTGVSALYSKGELVKFILNDDHTVLIGVAGTGENARTVFEVSLTDEGTGQFRFVLLDQLDHALGNNENDIGLSFNYTATDSDGDSVSGSFFVGVDDDVPVLTDAVVSGTVNESDIPVPVVKQITLDFQGDPNAAAPNLNSTHLHVSGGAGIVVNVFGGVHVLGGPNQDPGAKPLVFTADAGTTFTLNSILIGTFGATLSNQVTLKGTDVNGNVVTQTVAVNAVGYLGDEPTTLFNGLSGSFNNLQLTKLEIIPPSSLGGRLVIDNMSITETTTPALAAAETVVDLTPLVSIGADEQGTWSVTTIASPQNFGAISYNGTQITITSDGHTITGMAGNTTVFTLTVSADGHATFDLFKPIDGGAPVHLDFSQFVTVTDADGDRVTLSLGDFLINVGSVDHLPTISAPAISVDEKGLPPHNGLPAGSGEIADNNPNNNSDSSEIKSGTITVNLGDTPSSVTINGFTVAVGQNIVGLYGTLHIDSVTATSIGYTYTLTTNTSGEGTHDDFLIVVTDFDGQHADKTLTVNIIDDKPQAHDDTGSIGEDAASVTVVAASGVLSNDVAGADGGKTVTTTGSFTGTYGTLVLNGDGSYTYTL